MKIPLHLRVQEYVDFIVDFIERTSPDIVFQRLFATAPDSILIAPDWGRSRHKMLSDIEKRLEARDTRQGSKYRLQPVLHTVD
jgi:radical SAM superfamily enzyme